MTESPPVLSPAALRKQHLPVEELLPCGLLITRRKTVPLDEMVAAGVIPTPLLAVFMAARKGGDEAEAEAQTALDQVDAAEFFKMLDAAFKLAVISPKVTDDPPGPDDNDSIWIHESFLTIQDKSQVFSAVMEGVASFTPFRNGTTEPGAPGDAAPAG